MESFANEGGMISEQIWDTDDIPECNLYRGRPTGSASPLAWAHAEYVKLRRSILEGRVFDMPLQTVERYLVRQQDAKYAIWRFTCQPQTVQVGKTLRLELGVPATVHWGIDGWQDPEDINTRDTSLGMHVADLPTSHLSTGQSVDFTFYWPSAKRWEGKDFSITFHAAAHEEQARATSQDYRVDVRSPTVATL
jgi:glucoamylase